MIDPADSGTFFTCTSFQQHIGKRKTYFINHTAKRKTLTPSTLKFVDRGFGRSIKGQN